MRILFFTPFGGLSGSEMVLWYLLHGLNREEFHATLFCRHHGELLTSMPDGVPAYSALPAITPWERINERVGRRFRSTSLYEDRIVRLHQQVQPDLWYINTLMMPELVPLARKLGVPFALHVHEMPMVYGEVTGEELKSMIEGAVLTIASSEASLEYLRVLGPKNLELQYECVDLRRTHADVERADSLRRALGVGDTDYLWGMSGRFEYRKGADLFVELARSFQQSGVHFLWVGSAPDKGFDYFVKKAIEYDGLENVHLVGKQTDDYYNYLSCIDCFLLTSREDPFPLVMIEAAALGKPIVSFNSGGVKEFVRPGMGAVIDSWNPSDLAAAMIGVMKGETAFDPRVALARAEEFDASAQVRHWEKIMRRYFAGPSAD